MTDPTWLSQRVPPLGAITSEGIMQALGRPAMSRLTVLVREAAQNSWDAQDPDRLGPVDFEIELRHLRGAERDAWSGVVAAHAPPDEYLPLRSELDESEAPLVMFVSDRNTAGLGGPTRADAAATGSRDYAAFVLNIGEPRDTPLGGGTYGFGKSIFFSASRAQTIVISTRCATVAGAMESRLVGCALGHSFSDGDTNFTGRHWWGLRVAGEEAIEPIRGADADSLSERLGFPGFADGATGTSVAVICPDLDGQTPEEAANWLVEAVLWHLWPKMLRDAHRQPEMSFRIAVDGAAIPIPAPRDHPAVRLFVDAFDEQRGGAGELLACRKPRQNLGTLALRRSLALPPVLSDVAREAGVEDGPRHVCLMRAANLVVNYHQGPPTADETVPYAGVFKPLFELDDTFARAEPPTHDDWVAEQLEGHARTFVRQAFVRIDESLRQFAAPADVRSEASAVQPLGAASRMLAGLLGTASGLGASTSEPGAGTDGTGGARPVRLVGTARWEPFDNQDLLVQRVQVNTAHDVCYRGEVGVAGWGSAGIESDPPAASRTPVLVGWIDGDDRLHECAVMSFTPADNGEWRLAAEPPDDAAVTFRVHQTLGEGGSE